MPAEVQQAWGEQVRAGQAEPGPRTCAEGRSKLDMALYAVAEVKAARKACFNNFWAEREKKKRTLKLRLAVLRKARVVKVARNAWSAVRRQLGDARLQRAQALRPKRMSAVLHDVAVQCKQAKLARKTKTKGPPPARVSRINLTAAATVGPVLTDMYVAARGPLGDG